MKKIFAMTMIVGGLAAGLPAFPQESRTYTIGECVAEAVRNNLSLRNAGNEIAMAGEQRREAFTKYFPTVSAMGGGFIANKGMLEMDLGGMTMSLAKDGLVAGVTAMQPVFAGGQIVNGNKLAKVGEEAARLQRGLSENEVRLNTEKYYWQLVQLKENLRTLDLLGRQLERAHQDAQNAVDAGVRNRNDLLQVQLRQNEVKASVIKVENAAATVRDLLAQVMGRAGESVEVDNPLAAGGDAASYPMPESPQRLYQPEQSSLQQTCEYRLLDKQVEADRLQYKLAVGKNLPTVAVGGGYLYNNVMDKSQNRLVGMFSVSVPISGWWGGSHDMKRRKLQVENAENEKRDKGELLVVRMRKAWNDLSDAYRQVEIARESIAQSEENLRLNTDYYQTGTATMSDLLDAQSLYQQSRDKYVQSFTDYEVKKREYLQATGR